MFYTLPKKPIANLPDVAVKRRLCYTIFKLFDGTTHLSEINILLTSNRCRNRNKKCGVILPLVLELVDRYVM